MFSIYNLIGSVQTIALILILTFFIYFTINLQDPIKEGNSDVCPPPIYATDPDANTVDNLLINNFMSYMDNKIQQVNSDLDVIATLIEGSTFNLIIDPSNIPDVSSNKNLPFPIITMDSTNPPNYGVAFKLPRGRQGRVGPPGKNGLTGGTGVTGPMGPDGASGKWLIQL
jgi:hypothetical protein